MNDRRTVTKRVVLHVGYACNLRCRFCYYLEELKNGKTKNWTTEQLKRRLRFARRLGKTAVDFTGGEPSIRKDILELFSFAREIGYQEITMITNGLRLTDKDFCQAMVQTGLNDVLFSIHSPFEEEHDYLTCVKGSYRRIFQAMDNMQELDIGVRVNSVVSNVNYQHVHALFELLKPYNPDAVNLIVFNPSETTVTLPDDDGTRIEDYWTISQEIGTALDRFADEFKAVNVRFLPFCLLPGHESVIRTQWQKMYEDKEWDPFLNIAFQKGYWATLGAFGAGLFLYPFFTPKFGKRDLYTLFNEIISTFRMKLYYRQPESCRRCSLRKVCTGLQVDYVKRFNKTKLIPYELGQVIDDPLYYCHELGPQFESVRLSTDMGVGEETK